MPFVAVCPYCRVSKYRAPSRKRGTFVTCSKCREDFMLLPADDDRLPPVEYKLPPFAPLPTPAAAEVHETATADGPTEPVAPAPAEPAAIPAELYLRPADLPPPVRPPAAPAHHPDYALRMALAALGLVGVAVLASQLPYGRFVAAPLAAAGAVMGLLSVLGLEERPWLGWAGAGANGFAFLLVVAWPGWLGLSTWTPAADPETRQKPVTAVGRDGTPPRPADWVDAMKAVWEHDDVRVALTAVTAGPDEPAAVGPAAPPAARPRKKDRTLRVTLKLTNVGVARAIEFNGWAAAPPAEPTLTTAGGKALPAKPAAPADPVLIVPGKSAETTLAFAPPDGPPEDLRLELPAAAFGGTEPARFRIPRTMIHNR